MSATETGIIICVPKVIATRPPGDVEVETIHAGFSAQVNGNWIDATIRNPNGDLIIAMKFPVPFQLPEVT